LGGCMFCGGKPGGCMLGGCMFCGGMFGGWI
jgi:hypothetical protein